MGKSRSRFRVGTKVGLWRNPDFTGLGTTTFGVAGYSAGGYATTYLGDIDKLTFSTETKTTLSATLTTNRYYASGMANSGVAGYINGGDDGSYTGASGLKGTDKITFPTDTKSALATQMMHGTANQSSSSNSGVVGYIIGGYANDYGNWIDKLTFLTELISASSTVLSLRRYQHAACSNHGAATYVAGGSGESGNLSNIEKLTFSTEAMSTLSAILSRAYGVNGVTGMANSSVAGYFVGGSGGAGQSDTIDKLAFSTDTRTTLAAVLTTPIHTPAGYANSGVAGYIAGGHHNYVYKNGIDRIDFTSDTKTILSATLTSVRRGVAGFANEGVF